MAEIPIVIGAVYAAMGVYNAAKTCISVYQDARKFKKYLIDRRKKAENGGACIEMEEFNCFEDLDTFYMIGETTPEQSETDRQNPFIESATPDSLKKPTQREDGKVVILGFFTLI